MFLYLKQIHLSFLAALTGAIAWMFNGYVMVWFEFQNVMIIAAAFPATLFFMERWLKTGKRSHLFYLIGTVCYTISSAYAHLIIYQLLFAGTYFIYRYMILKRNNSQFGIMDKIKTPVVWLSFIVVICTSSTFLLSHLSFLEEHHRREFSFDELTRSTGQLPARYLATLIFPDFFGSPAGSNINFPPRIPSAQPYNNYNELCVYAGIVPLLLLLTAAPFIAQKRDARFYMFAALISLSMAMGSILYYPFYKFIPGLNISTPTRILYLFGFSVSVLAAIGADILLCRETGKKRVIFILWILLGIAAIGISIWVQTEAGAKWFAGPAIEGDWHHRGHVIQNHFALTSKVVLKPILLVLVSILGLSGVLFAGTEKSKVLFLILSIIILAVDLVSFGSYYNTASSRSLEFPETGAIRFLKKDKSVFRIMTVGQFMHNSFAPFDIQDAGGYASFYPRRYAEYIHLSQSGPGVPFPENFSRWMEFTRFGSPLLDLINIKYVLVPPSEHLKVEHLKLVYSGEVNIYENTSAFQRVFFVPDYQFSENRQSAYNAIVSYHASDFKNRVILETRPLEESHQVGNGILGADPVIRLMDYKPDRVEIQISTDINGFLVISDNYHPDWDVAVDGEPGRIFRANYIMRAIPIQSGNHTVSLRFHPKLLPWGLRLTASGWILMGLMIPVFVFRKSRK